MKFLCTVKNALLIIRDHFGLFFDTKGLGYLAARCLPLPLLTRYKLSYYQTTCYRLFQCLLKTTCHFLLLLVGFDTLTYRKDYDRYPILVGHHWSPKKQNYVSLSTTEAEYIAAGSCCAQLLWMKQTLKDYGINVKNVPLYCDNESAIKIAHNPVQHSKTKHIQIRHHFLHDHVLKGDISIEHVKTEE